MQQQGIGNLNDQNDAWDQLNQNQKDGFVERTKNNFTNIYKGIVG